MTSEQQEQEIDVEQGATSNPTSTPPPAKKTQRHNNASSTAAAAASSLERSETTSIHTARLVRSEIRKAIATEIKSEVNALMKSRYRWKKGGDYCEAIAKGLTGVGSILAFASSATRDAPSSEILAFVSGCVGTVGLVLLTYAAYASRESRQRTTELNGILQVIGVTPMPEITSNDNEVHPL